MRKIPSHVRDFDKKNFENYVCNNLNAFLYGETNEYEVIRYRTPIALDKFRLSNYKIIYKKKNGRLTFTNNSDRDYQDFLIFQEREEKMEEVG